ncbi:MAG: hypothetical protein KDA52_16280 [Planctomycetaceae bacterium]|nr:hypothetical protein [Planctomycetaceae bacterium]
MSRLSIATTTLSLIALTCCLSPASAGDYDGAYGRQGYGSYSTQGYGSYSTPGYQPQGYRPHHPKPYVSVPPQNYPQPPQEYGRSHHHHSNGYGPKCVTGTVEYPIRGSYNPPRDYPTRLDTPVYVYGPSNLPGKPYGGNGGYTSGGRAY